METLNRYKSYILFAFTLILSLVIISFIAFRFISFQNSREADLNIENIKSNESNEVVTPTLEVTEAPGFELSIGNKIAGTEETIEIFSTNTVAQDQVEIVRLFIENGQVLEVTSPLVAFPACLNEKMFTMDKVCLDVTKFTPMNVNELVAVVKIRWDEHLEGKIWREKEAGIYVNEEVLGQNTINQTEETAKPLITDNTIPSNYEKYSYVNTYEQIALLAGVVIVTLLVVIFFEKSQKGKKVFKAFRVIVIINLLVFTVYIGNFINQNYIAPESIKADIPTIDVDDLVQPVLDIRITNVFGPRAYPHCSAYKLGSFCHTGIDLGGKDGVGLTVFSAGPGIVIATQYGWNDGYGNNIVIQHNTNQGPRYTRYCHLASIYINQGDSVNENTEIGLMGTTGNSTGIHLHFELLNHFSYAASSFEDPTAIVHRVRGSNPPGDDEAACGEHCNIDDDCVKGSNVKEVECDQKENTANNKCIILECKAGYSVDGCTCKVATITPTSTLPPSFTPTPSSTFTPTPSPIPGIVCGPMDSDGNDQIDIKDLVNFVVKYRKRCSDNYTDTKYGPLDANKDGTTNVYDIQKFKSYYNKGKVL